MGALAGGYPAYGGGTCEFGWSYTYPGGAKIGCPDHWCCKHFNYYIDSMDKTAKCVVMEGGQKVLKLCAWSPNSMELVAEAVHVESGNVEERSWKFDQASVCLFVGGSVVGGFIVLVALRSRRRYTTIDSSAFLA